MVEKSLLIGAIMESAQLVSDGKIKGTRNIPVMKCFHVHLFVSLLFSLYFKLEILNDTRYHGNR